MLMAGNVGHVSILNKQIEVIKWIITCVNAYVTKTIKKIIVSSKSLLSWLVKNPADSIDRKKYLKTISYDLNM